MCDNSSPYRVLLTFYRGSFDEIELDDYKKKLINAGIEMFEYDKSGRPMASLQDFTNQISLLINDALFQAFIMGLATNGSYDLIKQTIIWMWNSLKNKKLTMISASGKKEEDATFGITISVDHNTSIDFRLSGEVSDELKNKCIDKAFNFAKTLKRKPEPTLAKFSKYDWDKHEWYIVDINKEIDKIIQEQRKKEGKH